MSESPVVVFGTYDREKQRARILLAGLRAQGVALHEVNAPVWSGVRDKGVLRASEKLAAALRTLVALPGLVLGYLRAPRHRVVLVPYLGVFDVLLVAPFAWARGARVAWDLFISPYDTVVNDRRVHSRWHPLALVLYCAEWFASRLADRLFIDTAAHARRFESLMGLPVGRVGAVPLGTDPERFPSRRSPPQRRGALRVLFYGQFIPLHGIDTIIDAARLVEAEGAPVTWTFVGAGQERARAVARIEALGLGSITMRDWVEPSALPALIHDHDVGLGIFGTSDKALTVVPNKVYELAATQTPIITGDTPAMQEFGVGHPWITRVAPGSAQALATAVIALASRTEAPAAPPMPIIGPREVGAAAVAAMELR